MASLVTRSLLFPIPFVIGERMVMTLTRRWHKGLEDQLCGKATDKFLELLLGAMDLAFCLSPKYRRNIHDFQGRYLFRSADRRVSAGAVFQNGNMKVYLKGLKDWDACVSFKDAPALRAFLMSRDQDILDALLNNSVEVEGNLNYIYKFGYMANELKDRLMPAEGRG
jgi:hypothetical protein